MREIKFRAWDKTLQAMKGFDTFCIYEGKPIDVCEDIYVPEQGGGTYEKGFRSVYGEVKFNDDVIPMEFTGLKDKNGKEIYEGDILLCTKEIMMSNMTPTIYRKDCKSVVCYTPSSFFTKNFDITWRGLEVIGNIYENPKLAKDAI